ncbi:TfuA-like protein [Streptomyces lydicus]|uniref:TfuA-like protein n=1 Tax=Streptomyces lydicus TaxID=47763 RepID=UPI0037219BF0
MDHANTGPGAQRRFCRGAAPFAARQRWARATALASFADAHGHVFDRLARSPSPAGPYFPRPSPATAGDLRRTADDEVPLLHGSADEGYRPLSEALVNLRATLRRCIQDGLFDESAAGHLNPDLMDLRTGPSNGNPSPPA